jgi:hypothetical protein
MKEPRHNSTSRTTLIAVVVAAACALLFTCDYVYQQGETKNAEIKRKQAIEFATHTLSIDSVIQAYRAARRDSELEPLKITTELLQQHRYLKPSTPSFKVTFATPLSLYDTVDITSHSDVYEPTFCRWLSTYENQSFFSEGVYVQSCGGGELNLVIEV